MDNCCFRVYDTYFNGSAAGGQIYKNVYMQKSTFY